MSSEFEELDFDSHPSYPESTPLPANEEDSGPRENEITKVTTEARGSITTKYSVSPGKEEERTDSLVERIMANRISVAKKSQTAPTDKEESDTFDSIDWSQIGNCWQYMMRISEESHNLDAINEMIKENAENVVKLEEEVEEEIANATPSDNVCKQCRIAAEKLMLRHQGSNYVVTDFGTFPTKPAAERQNEVYDLFVLHLSTIPAICTTCGGIYGYCDYWVPKIITITEEITKVVLFYCLLCSFKNKRGYNAIIHAKDHLSNKGMGLECGKCAKEILEEESSQDKNESIPDSNADSHDEDATRRASESELHSAVQSEYNSTIPQKLCKACSNVMDETDVPPPTLTKDNERAISENVITPVISLLFTTKEISMAKTQISKLKELELERATAVNEKEVAENVALKVSKMAIFCEQCGSIFDVVENAITKLKEQEKRIVSFFETIPEDERQFECSIPHATSLNEDILKESMLTHLSYYTKICDKCRNENISTSAIDDMEKIKGDMYDTLAFDLSTIYSECYRCGKKFSLCDSSVPKLISVVDSLADHNQLKFSYICLSCGKTNDWSFDSIHHAAMHVASKHNGSLCNECAEAHKIANYEEHMQPGFTDRAPSYVAIRFPEAKEIPVHCKNCDTVMGSMEDLIQMMFFLVMSDTGEPCSTYTCHICARSDLVREDVMEHAHGHREQQNILCEQCTEASK